MAISKGGPSWYVEQVKINLGVSLLQLGNLAWDPNVYSPLYVESEAVFLSVLEINSQSEAAQANLNSVRRSISLRPQAPENVEFKRKKVRNSRLLLYLAGLRTAQLVPGSQFH